jgi:hypothetical protein
MNVTCREELRHLIGHLSLRKGAWLQRSFTLVTGSPADESAVVDHLSLARLLLEAERATWPDIGGNAFRVGTGRLG